MQLKPEESAEAVRRVFAAPDGLVRALVSGDGVRVEVAERIEARLPDGCRGYRLEWEEVTRFEHGDFFGGNVETALTLRNAPAYYA